MCDADYALVVLIVNPAGRLLAWWFIRSVTGSVNLKRLITAASSRLGEWLELGASAGEQGASGASITGYGTQSASRQRRLLLKVEELP